MTSEFRTKNGSSLPSPLGARILRARPRGPAVPMGSSSWEQVILMPSLASHSLRKSIMT